MVQLITTRIDDLARLISGDACWIDSGYDRTSEASSPLWSRFLDSDLSPAFVKCSPSTFLESLIQIQ